MENIVFNREKMEFRYESGVTVYSEGFENGRLIALDYHASGMPLPQETRLKDVAVPAFELEVDGCDASFDWVYDCWKQSTLADGRNSAELTLVHPKLNLQARICTLCGDNGYFSRKLYIKNLSDRSKSITRVAPLSGVLWEVTTNDNLQVMGPVPFTVGRFKDCYWATEGNFDWTDIPYNTTIEFGSRAGRSGHGHPFAVVHNRAFGGYFLCQMEWSSNWKFRFHNEHRKGGDDGFLAKMFARLTFSLAPQAIAPMRIMESGEEVEMPLMSPMVPMEMRSSWSRVLV